MSDRDLVFLHGGSHGSWCWAPLLDHLRAHPITAGRLIALDMPGCGVKRGRDVGAETLASITAELNGELREAGVRGAVLVGHSIAGILLPMMAAADPALYAHLVFLATSLPEEGQSIMQMMGTSLHGADPDHVGWPADPATPFPELLRLMFAPDMTPEQIAWVETEIAQDVTPPACAMEPATRAGYPGAVPSTYIVTERDPILPPLWQRRFAERAGSSTVVSIDTPHEPFITHPALLAETLGKLIE